MAPTTRKSRSTTSSRVNTKAHAKKVVTSRKAKAQVPTETSDGENAVTDEEYNESHEEKEYDSDALDDDSAFEAMKKRKRQATTPRKGSTSPRKKRKVGDDADVELADGQEVVGVVVQAPKTGLVPPGQVSQNTFDFLVKLKNPKYNDRTWFKLNEPVYRVAEKEWKDFVEAFTDVLIEVDPQIPHLPPKDVIHRIYRDVRFSNDKTPYKKSFSASFSRSGRKGIFGHYHISIQPGNQTLIASGSWCPGKNELATIRANIQRNPRRLRDVISAPKFVKFFGEAKPHPKGERRNIFGAEDELKNAPKGVEKDHKDIDLLKCRSFAVVHRFTDSEVLSVDFKEKLADVAKIMRPFVHCLNDMTTIQSTDDDDEEDEEDEDEQEGGEDDGEDEE